MSYGRFSFGALCLLSLGVAGYALAVYALLPLGATVHPDMRTTFTANAAFLYPHVFASAVTLGDDGAAIAPARCSLPSRCHGGTRFRPFLALSDQHAPPPKGA